MASVYREKIGSVHGKGDQSMRPAENMAEREEVSANLALSDCFKIPTVLWSVVTNCCT